MEMDADGEIRLGGISPDATRLDCRSLFTYANERAARAAAFHLCKVQANMSFEKSKSEKSHSTWFV